MRGKNCNNKSPTKLFQFVLLLPPPLEQLGDAERVHKHDTDGTNEQLDHVRRQIDQLQVEKSDKSQECNLLQQRVGLLAVVERQHNDCANRIKVSVLLLLLLLFLLLFLLLLMLLLLLLLL